MIVKVPMKRHVLQYVVALEGIKTEEPIALTGPTLVANFLAQCISTKKMLANDRRTELPQCYERTLLVKVNGNRMSRCYSTLPLRSVVAVNNFFHQLFIRSMIQYVSEASEKGLNGHEAIRRFLAYYDIEEESYSFDAAKKSVFRGKTRSITA